MLLDVTTMPLTEKYFSRSVFGQPRETLLD
jgi:hypothetical protein